MKIEARKFFHCGCGNSWCEMLDSWQTGGSDSCPLCGERCFPHSSTISYNIHLKHTNGHTYIWDTKLHGFFNSCPEGIYGAKQVQGGWFIPCWTASLADELQLGEGEYATPEEAITEADKQFS